LQARVEATATCPADTTVCNPADGTRAGGGGRTADGTGLSLGVEKALTPNFMIRGQYQYSQYEAADLIVLPYINGSSFGAEAEVELNSDTFELGAAYLFWVCRKKGLTMSGPFFVSLPGCYSWRCCIARSDQ